MTVCGASSSFHLHPGASSRVRGSHISSLPWGLGLGGLDRYQPLIPHTWPCGPQGRPGAGHAYHEEVLRGQGGRGAAALPAPVSSRGGAGPPEQRGPPRPRVARRSSTPAGHRACAETSGPTRSLLSRSLWERQTCRTVGAHLVMGSRGLGGRAG